MSTKAIEEALNALERMGGEAGDVEKACVELEAIRAAARFVVSTSQDTGAALVAMQTLASIARGS